MTGLEFANSLKIKLAEVGTGFMPTPILQDIVDTANINIVDRKIEEYQVTNKITREIQILITNTGIITPINATVDVSFASTVAPDYYNFGNLLVTSPFMGSTVSEYASEKKMSQFKSPYASGVARYPTYNFASSLLIIEPADVMSCVLTYFTNPLTIDVTNNTNQIQYNKKLIQLLISECMVQAGVDNRDPAAVELGQMEKTANP